MTEKVVHGADPWGWEKVPRSELVALACISPHACEVPGCPGPVNKRKLEAFEELLAALEGLLATEDSDSGDCQWCLEDVTEYSECTNPKCPGVIARTATTRAFWASPQAR